MFFVALISSFIALYENDIVVNELINILFLKIGRFYDFIYKKVRINYDGTEK
jgi:hypothetical protein